MPLLLAFDFDGVIVDSIQSLKDTYHNFLSDLGFVGSDSEFQSLNGPSIKQVVAILRGKYQIDKPYEELLKDYKKRLNEAYIDAPLIDNAYPILKKLRKKNIDLALVTSSDREEVEVYLKKHQIEHFFKSVVTGDEFSEAKPSPDIYLCIKEQFPDHSIWAIEDSYNGMMAAIEAGVKVIYFDQFSTGTNLSINCRISSLDELNFFVEAHERDCCVMEKTNAISVNIEDSFCPKLNDQQEIRVKEIWETTLKSRSLHDGEILYYLSHSSFQGNVSVKAFWGSYRYFYSRLQDSSLRIPFVPLAVSGICSNDDDLVLIANRINVTEYESRLEFVPSGGISSSVQEGKSVDYKRQLTQELLEETPLKIDSISIVNELGIIEDLSNNVIEICCLLKIKGNDNLNSKESPEYRGLKWMKTCELLVENMIPTSSGLFYLYKTKEKF